VTDIDDCNAIGFHDHEVRPAVARKACVGLWRAYINSGHFAASLEIRHQYEHVVEVGDEPIRAIVWLERGF
jgi:hypothetical protein